MRFNPATQKLNNQVEAQYLRQILTALILLALLFMAVGVVVFETRAQHPSCADLKKRVDDATRVYQSILLQSQAIDKNFMAYQTTVKKIQDDLIANQRRKQLAERDVAAAQSDRARCERDANVLPAGACGNVTHRIDTAENRLSYFTANEKRLEGDLVDYQRKLASAKATMRAVNANLTTAQQDLEEANKSYAAVGCQ